jgi:hypothetical protein
MQRPSKPAAAAPPIKVGTGSDGSVIYLVDLPPAAMPSVRASDLARAWESAREAARARSWSVPRGLRFHRGDGTYIELALADRDATCWAGAVDRIAGLNTSYGLSLCLRLLALVDLLARAAWATPLLALQPEGACLDPCLLRLAARATLTEEARFDEERFRADLVTGPDRPKRL